MKKRTDLPKEHSVVLVSFESGNIEKCYYADGYFQIGRTGMNWSKGKDVVNWCYVDDMVTLFETTIFQRDNSVFSNDYLKWVKQANLPPLTNTQHKFAEWLFSCDISKRISQIGDMESIFISVRKWLKKNNSKEK